MAQLEMPVNESTSLADHLPQDVMQERMDEQEGEQPSKEPERTTVGQEGPDGDDGSETPGIIYAPRASSHAQPLKSILRRPSVRFAADLDEEDQSSQSPPQSPPMPYMQFDKSFLVPQDGPVPFLLRPPAPPSPPPQVGLPPVAGPRPPSLFTHKIDTDPYLSEVALDLYNSFLNELSQFVNHQGEVVRKRLQVRGKRTNLARLREHVSQCDIMLFDYMRKRVSNEAAFDDTEFMALYEAARSARDEVGPTEAEFDVLEAELGADENKLLEKYSDLEAKFEHFFDLDISSVTKNEPVQIEYESEGSSSDEAEGIIEMEAADVDLLHGAIVGEQIKVGEMPFCLSSDRRSSGTTAMQAEGNMLEKPQTSHHSERGLDEIKTDLIGIAGSEDPSMYHSQELQREHEKIPSEDSFFGLERETLFGAYEHPGSDPQELATCTSAADHSAIYLSNNDQQSRVLLHNYLMYFDCTPHRVSQWLLHQLRISLWEIHALRAFCEEQMSDETWAEVALKEWSDDDMGYDQLYYSGSLEDTSEIPEAPPGEEAQIISTPPLPPAKSHHRMRSSLVSNIAHPPTVSDINDNMPLPLDGDEGLQFFDAVD